MVDPVFSNQSTPYWLQALMRKFVMPWVPFQHLALGDSYTVGECVPYQDCWPVQLADYLQAQRDFHIQPTIVAQTGWTTRDLLTAISDADFHGRFDLVSLLIGVNNQYQGLCLNQFQAEIRQLLQKAISQGGAGAKSVVVLSIPDWSVTPHGAQFNREKVRAEIDQHNGVLLAESRRSGTHLVDITPISRQAWADPSLVAGDGLHPSAGMYAAWVTLIGPLVSRILCKLKKSRHQERSDDGL
jgi:lysophospholipase L1-like esterase